MTMIFILFAFLITTKAVSPSSTTNISTHPEQTQGCNCNQKCCYQPNLFCCTWSIPNCCYEICCEQDSICTVRDKPAYIPQWKKYIYHGCCASPDEKACGYTTDPDPNILHDYCCPMDAVCCGTDCCSGGDVCCGLNCTSAERCCPLSPAKICPEKTECCGNLCCPSGTCCNGTCCKEDSICSPTDKPIYIPSLQIVMDHGCCNEINEKVCSISVLNGSTLKNHCCSKEATCCGNDQCCKSHESCCNQTCVPTERCCPLSPSIVCPEDSTCCGDACCSFVNRTCYNKKCYLNTKWSCCLSNGFMESNV